MESKIILTLKIGVIAFFLNLAWEAAHGLLYLNHLTMPAVQYVLMIFYAACVDALLIGGLFFLTSGMSSLMRARQRRTRFLWILFLSSALIIAYSIEYHALLVGKWAYSSAMPVVFGVGLSPLLQLAITGSISLLIILKREGRFV